MKSFINDLEYARTMGLVVDVGLLNGDKLLTGVHEVNEEDGFVSLHATGMLESKETTKVPLDLIASVTVTDSKYRSD